MTDGTAVEIKSQKKWSSGCTEGLALTHAKKGRLKFKLSVVCLGEFISSLKCCELIE